MTTDELIEALAQRAADPARRVDAPTSELDAAVSAMGLGGLASLLGSVAGDLGRVVAANRAGTPLDPELVARGETYATAMGTAAALPLPGPADPRAVDAAEKELGTRFPMVLRRAYIEVADGGFGPGKGLFSLADLSAEYRRLRTDPPTPRGLSWPTFMIPLADATPGYLCLDAGSGRVVDWDPELTDEDQDETGWTASFAEVAADVERWLETWVVSKTPAEQHADSMAEMRRQQLRVTKARIAAMAPEERAAAGLPEEGWEAAFIDEDDV